MRHAVILIALLAACGDDASHLPNPVSWPVLALGNAVDNGLYDARRARVSAHVQAHHGEILEQIGAGGGPQLGRAMELAGVAQGERAGLVRRLGGEIAMYRNDPEALVIAFMVYGA